MYVQGFRDRSLVKLGKVLENFVDKFISGLDLKKNITAFLKLFYSL